MKLYFSRNLNSFLDLKKLTKLLVLKKKKKKISIGNLEKSHEENSIGFPQFQTYKRAMKTPFADESI